MREMLKTENKRRREEEGRDERMKGRGTPRETKERELLE